MLAQFDGDEGSGHQVDLRAAVLRRNIETIEAHGPGRADESLPVFLTQTIRIRIQIEFQRHDLFTHEASHHAYDQLLLLA